MRQLLDMNELPGKVIDYTTTIKYCDDPQVMIVFKDGTYVVFSYEYDTDYYGYHTDKNIVVSEELEYHQKESLGILTDEEREVQKTLLKVKQLQKEQEEKTRKENTIKEAIRILKAQGIIVKESVDVH